MTTTSATLPTSTRPSRPSPPGLAAVFGAVALNAFGIWGDGTPGSEDEALVSFLVVCGIIAVGAASSSAGSCRGLCKPRSHRPGRRRRAGAFGPRAAAGRAVFWTGLPPVLAVGGIVLGLAGRGAARSGMATAAVAVGLLAVLADIAVYVSDWMSTNGMM